MSVTIGIREFQEQDANAVRDLFVLVNRQLAPPGQSGTFETYIARSLAEEIGCIAEYYGVRDGGFWVAYRDGKLAGMFGLERAGHDAMELRRMYVDPSARRGGIARSMLQFAEERCRRLGARRLELSTSELQPAALALYRGAGYRLLREEAATQASNKTVGGGIRRYYFEKTL
jgi:GNAT superfamily N-acetyltransferase